jgi:hypothetical protein
MVQFDDLPVNILKRFVIEENGLEDSNRIFLIKKRIPIKEWKIFKKKVTTKGIPHKYQQNNTLEEASESIRKYIIEEMGIEPSIKYSRRPSRWVTSLKFYLRRFGVRL